MDHQHPFLPGGSGFSPFAAGSPQQQQVSAGLGSSLSLNRFPSSNSPGVLGLMSPGQTSAAASPAIMQPVIAAAELLSKASSMNSSAFGGAGAPPSGYNRSTAVTLAAAGRQLSAANAFPNQQLQFYQQQQQPSAAIGSPWRSLGRIDSSSEDVLAAAVAAAGLAPPPPPPPYSNTATPLTRTSTANAQPLLYQQQQQLQQAALARSLSVDVGTMSGAKGYLGDGSGGGRWGGGRLLYDTTGFGGHEQQGRFGSVYDMKSLTAALAHVQAGTGDVRRMLAACTFRPRLPGLTKLVSQMSREGHWAKALEVYESLDAVAVRPDTTITNAAISACDKGGQWEKALHIFKSMSDLGMERDAITYSALISALSKGRQWGLAIDVFNHMVAEGVECDAVTCCSLITALDKGGQWQLAEQVFIQMYRHHPQFHVLLEGMDTDPDPVPQNGNGGQVVGSNGQPERALSLLAGTFTTAALNALSISEDALPPPEQLLAMMEASGSDVHKSSSSKDQNGKPTSSADRTTAGAASAETASGKLKGYLGATLRNTSVIATNTGINSTANGNNGTSSGKFTAGLNITRQHNVINSTSGLLSGASSSHVAVTAAGATLPAEASKSDSKADSQVQLADGKSSDAPFTTLSCVWSKIVASKAMAKAQTSSAHSTSPPRSGSSTPNAGGTSSDAAATGASSSNTAAGTEGEGPATASSDESLLTASDAVVHLMPAGKFRLIDAKASGHTGPETKQPSPADYGTVGASHVWGAAHHTSSASSDGSAAHKPPTSAFEAAGAVPLEADAAAAQDQQHKVEPSSPHRPPLHPVKHAGTLSASHTPGPSTQSSAQPHHGLSPAGSLGLTSPGSASSPSRTNSGTMLRLGLTRSLNSKKSSPNRVCCNALLAAYARATPPRWRQALKLLDVMWQCGGELVPDIVSYNTVMKACGNAQQTDKAFELYQHMQQRGIEPTVATFGTLITIASEAQAYEKVKESWGWLQASGLPVHITCVNSYLTALIKEDNWDAAVALFQQLKSNQLGVRPNSVTYNILMSACLARDRPQLVKGLFDEMTSANLSPTLISFNTLLHSYAKTYSWQDSLKVLQHMCTSSPVRPSTASFNTVLSTLATVADMVGETDKQVLTARALDVYHAMSQLPGLHPDSALYRTIINALSACAAPKMVLQVAMHMTQQGHTMDAASASAALEALQAENAWALSGPLLAACMEAGTIVSPLLLQHILLVATQDKSWRIAKEVLQVTSAANQLDAVAQLLQQTRTALQAASADGRSADQQFQLAGLVGEVDGLDELLFLTYLQAQYSNGGWSEAIGLFKQLQQDRGSSFAVCNGVLLGALLELLVVRGGLQGTLEAVSIVDSCHARGVMSHYIPVVTANSSAAGPTTSSPPSSAHDPAAAAGLLSPEQSLIWQLESSYPAASSSSGMGVFSLFPGVSAAQQAAPASTALDLSSLDFGQAPEGFRANGLDSAGPVALSVLDVRGCSAIEALVLVLSWLGQLIMAVGAGQPPGCSRLRIETGSVGPMDPVQATALRLCYPVIESAQGSCNSSVAGTSANARGEAPACSEEDCKATVSSSAPAAEPATAAAPDVASLAKAAPTGLQAGPRAGHTPLQPPAGTAGVDTMVISHPNLLQVPGSNLSVHTVVLALLSGQLAVILDTNEPMELLVACSTADRLPLGLVCLSGLPFNLPDELQGGGVEVSVPAAVALITSMLATARGQGNTA